MEHVPVPAVLAVLASVIAAVGIGAWWVARALRAGSDARVQTAVGSAVDAATERLGASFAAGGRELDLRGRAVEREAQTVSAELSRLRELVAQLQQRSAAQHGAVVENLRHVASTSSELAAHTRQLREALASPKQRGQWGERMAEDVLRAAGFQEGVNYRKQTATRSGSIPDFTFPLPGGLELRMDVKFPIDNYLRFLDAADDDARSRARTAFVRDVRGRIKELARRDYVDPAATAAFVVLFIPNEAVYAFLHEHDPEVIDVALGQQVVLTAPSSLFAVLAVVRHAVDQFRLERASDEILRCLTGVVDQWGRFGEQLDKVGRQLDTAVRGFGDLQGVRRRQLERQLEEVDRLHADRCSTADVRALRAEASPDRSAAAG